MTRRIAEALTLTLVWAALWSDLDLATLVSGLMASALILRLVPPSSFRRLGRAHPGRLLGHIAATVWRLTLSNIEVAREALTPGSRIHEAILAVPIGDVGDELATVISAGISLTPGTVTVGFRPGVVYVHVLHAADLDQTRENLAREVASVRRIFAATESEA